MALSGEFFIAYVGPYVDWQLEGPDGQGGGGTAAPVELLRFFTNVINDLIPQLGWEPGHRSSQRPCIRVLWLLSVDSD